MENGFNKEVRMKIGKSGMTEAGMPSGALNDEALEAAAGGLSASTASHRCHYCGKMGTDLTKKTITQWQGNAYGYGKPYEVWVCSNCLNAGRRDVWEKPFI